MDFTLQTFQLLLSQLLNYSFQFIPFKEYSNLNGSSHSTTSLPFIVLRHDVDRRPENALATAKIEQRLGIKGSYYFRMIPSSFNLKIMQKIAAIGHEIGYHYEDLVLVGKKMKSYRFRENGNRQAEHVKSKKWAFIKNFGNVQAINNSLERELVERGIQSFESNLALMRKVADISTICMHGNPLSPWDNRLLWKYFDYRNYGIIGEPYFDVNWNEVFYLTDTGRRWDGEGVSLRDKVGLRIFNDSHQIVSGNGQVKYRTTFDIIKAAKEGTLPKRIMLTVHPQRWTNRPGLWLEELVWQSIKNVIKRGMVKRKQNRKF